MAQERSGWALTLGPAAWRFGWKRDDWDRLDAAVVAGHIIECGAQCCGGNYSFFQEVPTYDRIGFPIAEMAADGAFVITKHPGTGGLVSVGTVTAQLLYEIDEPRYLNPDVTARFDSIRLEAAGPDRLRVTGVRGEPPPPTAKLCLNYFGGYRNSATFVLTGLDIPEKAKLVEDTFWKAVGGRERFAETSVTLTRQDREDPDSNEAAMAYLRFTVKDPDQAKVGRAWSNRAIEMAGKLAGRYQASSRLTLRAAASSGFRVPGLGQSHFSKVVTNVIGGVIEEIGVYPVDHPAAVALGAKPLRDETSLNFSAGLAVTPVDSLTITADYFYVGIDDRILLGATFDDDTTRAILAGAGFTDIAGVQYFTNGSDTKTQGLDLTANWRLPAGSGVLNLTGAVNYTKNEIVRVDPLPDVLANSEEPGIIDSVTWIGITEERPDWRGTLTAHYAAGRFSGLVRASYYGKFSSAQPGFCDLCRERYGVKTLFDAEAGYRFGQISLAIGVRNLLDTYPDQPSSLTDIGDGTPAKDYNNNFGTFPWAAASPFGYNGRFIYARMETSLGL